MTETDTDAIRRAKVEALQRRRSAAAPTPAPTSPDATVRTRPTKRQPVAQGSKIAATAIGVTAMFGMVGAMSVAAQQNDGAPPPTPAAPAQVVVVLHPAPGTATPTAAGVAPATPASPIALTAAPSVRRAAPAAAATTKASK